MERQCKLCKGGIPGIQFFLVVAKKDDKYQSATICPACRQQHAVAINERGWLVYMNQEWADADQRYLDKEAEDRYAIEDALEALGANG